MSDIFYNAEITISVLPQDLSFQLIGKNFFSNAVIMFYVYTFLFISYVYETEIKSLHKSVCYVLKL